jgi:hypothetical protein
MSSPARETAGNTTVLLLLLTAATLTVDTVATILDTHGLS